MLAYRAIAIWLPAPIGLVALGKLRGTMAAWGREDEALAAAPEVPAARALPGDDIVPALPVPSRSGASRPAWRPREAPCHAAA